MIHPYNALLRVLEQRLGNWTEEEGPNILEAVTQSDCITFALKYSDQVTAYRDTLGISPVEFPKQFLPLPQRWYRARNHAGVTITHEITNEYHELVGGRAISLIGLIDHDTIDIGYGVFIVTTLNIKGSDRKMVSLASFTVRQGPEGFQIEGVNPHNESEHLRCYEGDYKLRNLEPLYYPSTPKGLGNSVDVLAWATIALKWLHDPAVGVHTLEQTSEAIRRRQAKPRRKNGVSPRIDDRPRVVIVDPEEGRNLYASREHLGGTHASPRPHVRKAHTRVLRHPRYRHARGKVIEVDETRVGWKAGEEFRVGKTIYAVMPSRSAQSPIQGMEIA